MRISPGDIRLRYTGRIDRRNPERPEFIFPASSLGFRFWGKRAEIVLENRRVYWDNYVVAIVDGEQKSGSWRPGERPGWLFWRRMRSGSMRCCFFSVRTAAMNL